MDKKVRIYSVKRMTRKWPLIVFYKMIDLTAKNPYIIWLSLNAGCDEKLKKKRHFVIQSTKKFVRQDEKDTVLTRVLDRLHTDTCRSFRRISH